MNSKSNYFIPNAVENQMWTHCLWTILLWKTTLNTLRFDQTLSFHTTYHWKPLNSKKTFALFTLRRSVPNINATLALLYVVHCILGKDTLILCQMVTEFPLNQMKIIILLLSTDRKYTITGSSSPYLINIIQTVKVTLTLITWFVYQPIFKLVPD